jgi:hypothetical protein
MAEIAGCQADLTSDDLMEMLAAAFAQIEDFVVVQRAAGGPTVEAVELLQEAVGVDAGDRALVAARAEALGVAPETLLLGIVLGAMMRRDD